MDVLIIGLIAVVFLSAAVDAISNRDCPNQQQTIDEMVGKVVKMTEQVTKIIN